MSDLPMCKLFSKRQNDRVIFNRVDQSGSYFGKLMIQKTAEIL